MNFRRERLDEPDINLTPLIDVVFLLLIFFMVSTTFERESELAIELPEASPEAQPKEESSVDIGIDAEGRFYVNGRRLVNSQPITVREALRSAGISEQNPPVLNADAQAPYQAVITVMDVAQQLGYGHLRFATRPPVGQD